MDERTNLLVLQATEDEFSRAVELVKVLDVPLERPQPADPSPKKKKK